MQKYTCTCHPIVNSLDGEIKGIRENKYWQGWKKILSSINHAPPSQGSEYNSLRTYYSFIHRNTCIMPLVSGLGYPTNTSKGMSHDSQPLHFNRGKCNPVERVIAIDGRSWISMTLKCNILKQQCINQSFWRWKSMNFDGQIWTW